MFLKYYFGRIRYATICIQWAFELLVKTSPLKSINAIYKNTMRMMFDLRVLKKRFVQKILWEENWINLCIHHYSHFYVYSIPQNSYNMTSSSAKTDWFRKLFHLLNYIYLLHVVLKNSALRLQQMFLVTKSFCFLSFCRQKS